MHAQYPLRFLLSVLSLIRPILCPVSGSLYRRCDLWHYLLTKEPQSLDFMHGTICTQPIGRKHKILYFMEIALGNFYKLLIWWKGAHLKTCPAFTLIILGFMWKLWHKMSTFPYDVTSVSILPTRIPKNAQGHTYCKQSPHGLYFYHTFL